MAEEIRRIRPTPVDVELNNPHKGCCTFQHFNGQPLFPGVGWSEEGPVRFEPAGPDASAGTVDGYLPSTVAYCRWFWAIMEPRKAEYDFSMIDGALESCRNRGQTLAVRLMAFGSPRQPMVPEWYQKSCPTVIQKLKSAPQVVPVHDSKEYLEHWGGFIREFGRRYDSNPLLETIDVSYIGPWGEGAGDCCPEQCDRFAALWREAFPRTPRMALIEGRQLEAAVKTGAGWRCDCFGDLRWRGDPYTPRHASWAHMYDCYPPAIARSGASDAWKAGPVHFETCWVPMHWYREGFDLDFILEQGLKYHGTYFMPKYTRLPEAWMDKLAAFCRKLGYRYVYRQATYDWRVGANGKLKLATWIENTGVAPIYRRYDFAFRLRQGDNEQILVQDDIDIRTWLPGDVWLDRQLRVPESFRKGYVELAAGLVDPETKQAKVSFAVKESFGDRWVDLGGFEIV